VQRWWHGEIVESTKRPEMLIFLREGARVQSRWNSVWIQSSNHAYPLDLGGLFGEAKLEGLYLYSEQNDVTPMTTLDLPGAGSRGELQYM
jgi:hypothetical protein